MYKATIELGKISSIKIKFGLIISGEEDKKYNLKLLNKFNYMGSDYLRISPKPFITLDISTKKDENWTSNSFVNLNRVALYSFCKSLKKMINEFREISELYYYQNERLILNNKIAAKIYKDILALNNKTIRLVPTVVPDESNSEKFYEGCALCINSFDNFAYLSYSEMEYLLYELTHLDLNSLSLQLINTVLHLKDIESVELKKEKFVTETKEEEYGNESTVIPPAEGNVIPEI